MNSHPAGFVTSGEGFTRVTADLYSNGRLVKSGIITQLGDQVALLADAPQFSLKVQVGDELRIGSRVFRITENTGHHCPMSGLAAHYDVRIEEVV